MLIELPDLPRVLRLQQFGCVLTEVGLHVADVAIEHREGAVVHRSLDRLRKIDDDRAARVEQHVVLGQIAVDQAGTEHQHDLPDHEGVVLPRQFRAQGDLVETRSRVAVFVGDHLHQQHAAEVALRSGYAHAGRCEPVQGIDLRVLPLLFLLLASMARALAHGALVATAASLAAFLILRQLLEATVIGVLVDLGATLRAAAGNEKHRRFLAALQRAHDLVDDAVLDQRLESAGNFHES